MAYSDDNNFTTMQEEAIRRVREMQRRSRSIVGGNEQPAQAAQPKAEEHRSSQTTQKAPQSSSALGSLFGGSLGNIKIDEEKALIGLLIYILYKQGADVKLLLGLGYLLL